MSHIKKHVTFMHRSASVQSLFAWKERFDAGWSKKFMKNPTFVSYANRKFVSQDNSSAVQHDPPNDIPPSYNDVCYQCPPEEEENQRNVSFTQDFTALEHYLKRKLSIKKKSLVIADMQDVEAYENDMVEETQQVFRWLHELPDGNNLEEFLEAYGIPVDNVDMQGLKARLKQFLDEKLTSQAEIDKSVASWDRQISNLEELAHGDNLEKWLESLDVPYYRPLPETKEQIRKYLNMSLEDSSSTPSNIIAGRVLQGSPNVAAFDPKWKQLIDKMRELKDEDELDKWLDGLDGSCTIPNKEQVKLEIRKFFMHETWNDFQGKSIIWEENTIAQHLWSKFEDSGVLTKVGMIAGTTAVLGFIAVLSTAMLSFAFPPAFAINPFFTEVFAQYFLQRQEVAFNLLNFHAQNAKPLSTAWAKQYVLWKYC